MLPLAKTSRSIAGALARGLQASRSRGSILTLILAVGLLAGGARHVINTGLLAACAAQPDVGLTPPTALRMLPENGHPVCYRGSLENHAGGDKQQTVARDACIGLAESANAGDTVYAIAIR